jgi:Pyrimidine deaminase
MKQAIHAASLAVGNTYPNPAVGCVLVSSGEVIGAGFHPKAGYPHAEVFALFEACGLIHSGMDAAKVVVEFTKSGKSSKEISKVNELLEIYSTNDGAKQLFEGKLSNKDVTAYVTLEPCCHYGKTPPCALSLVLAGVSRVVVGYRDPNPRVDGGGVMLLQKEGIQVDLMMQDMSIAESKDEVRNAKACAEIVSAFVKRISPRTTIHDGMGLDEYETSMNGGKRSLLRSIAGRMKMEGSLVEISWPNSSPVVNFEDYDDTMDLEDAISRIDLSHRWMESVDGILWDKELILLRLGGAVPKKKGAKLLGERIAQELKAHVAQVVGHTVLLYRPGRPPVLDLN